eukprot:2149480-Pleurochrysis_carterae.AAC.1
MYLVVPSTRHEDELAGALFDHHGRCLRLTQLRPTHMRFRPALPLSHKRPAPARTRYARPLTPALTLTLIVRTPPAPAAAPTRFLPRSFNHSTANVLGPERRARTRHVDI